MKRLYASGIFAMVASALLFLSSASAGADKPHTHVTPAAGASASGVQPRGAVVPFTSCGSAVCYYGGPIMTGTVNLYLIWYGTWTDNTPTIVSTFFNNLSGSTLFNTNQQYYDSGGHTVSGALQVAGTTTDAYSQGTNLGDAQVQAVVSSAISSGRVPADSNGIYFVLTSGDVTVSQGGYTSCQSSQNNGMCGYHGHATGLLGFDAKYAWVGNPAACPLNCLTENRTYSPNGNIGADGMTDKVTHEAAETVTDPDINAWGALVTPEVGDLCNFVYGSQWSLSNGAYANASLGSNNYLVQGLWSNSTGGCAFPYASIGTPQFTGHSISGCRGTYEVSWSAVANATSYALWVQRPSTNYIVLSKRTTDTSAFVVAGVGGNTAFQVEACGAGGCGADSSPLILAYYPGCP